MPRPKVILSPKARIFVALLEPAPGAGLLACGVLSVSLVELLASAPGAGLLAHSVLSLSPRSHPLSAMVPSPSANRCFNIVVERLDLTFTGGIFLLPESKGACLPDLSEVNKRFIDFFLPGRPVFMVYHGGSLSA